MNNIFFIFISKPYKTSLRSLSLPKYRGAYSHGFTLIEILVVIIIMSIIAAIALPAIFHYKTRYEARIFSNFFNNILITARSEAVTRKQSIGICGSSNAQTCDNDWNKGALIFVDRAPIGQFNADTDTIITAQPLSLSFGSIRKTGIHTLVRFDYVAALSMGYNTSFIYCPQQAENARAVILSNVGILRFSQDSNGDGIHEDATGKNIQCS